MLVPTPRGQLSTAVRAALTTGTPVPDDTLPTAHDGPVVTDEDFQLALWMLYELHYRGFDDVDDAREWDPGLLAVRGRLEQRFEAELRERAADRVASVREQGTVEALQALTEPTGAPSLAAYLQRSATAEEVRAFLRQRSVYHLRESDPHSFVLARLDGSAKVALAELQYDEYGAGRSEALHSTLFSRALAAAGEDPTYGAHVDEATAVTLATNNAISLVTLHRRLRGAAMGHLAAFEATSSIPCRMIARGLERLDFDADVAAYYHEHVEADAAHEQIAIRDICGALVAAEPGLADDVLLGAAICLDLDDLAADQQLAAWAPSPAADDGTREAVTA